MARIEYDEKIKRYACTNCGDIVPSEMVRQFRFCPMCGRRVFRVITWDDETREEHEER